MPLCLRSVRSEDKKDQKFGGGVSPAAAAALLLSIEDEDGEYDFLALGTTEAVMESKYEEKRGVAAVREVGRVKASTPTMPKKDPHEP